MVFHSFFSIANHISESTKLQTDDEKIVTNQLYSDLFGDWLHFRPKTPDEEFDMHGSFGEEFPHFAENASLAVDIQRLTDSNVAYDQSNATALVVATPNMCNMNGRHTKKLTIDRTTDNTFTSNPFSYEHLRTNSQKTETYPFKSTLSPRYDDESSTDEMNLSGDSLPGLTLSLGDNEANDKAIDTLLEECNGKIIESLLFIISIR